MTPRGVDARRLFAPTLGNITYYTQDRRSNYHSFQASLTKRLSRGFTVLANYTFSKSIDNHRQDGAGGNGYVTPWYFPDGDSLMRGPSDFDHRQRFVVSYVWELPNLSTGSAVVRTLLHGWQWTGIGEHQTGRPFTVTSGRDNSQTGNGADRAQLTGTSWKSWPAPTSASGLTRQAFAVNDVGTFGTVGKNSLYGPAYHSWDMGVFKNFRITEQVEVQFRAEFFNIFNQTNFDAPVANAGNNTAIVTAGGFGSMTRTLPGDAGDPRIMQFGLKLVF